MPSFKIQRIELITNYLQLALKIRFPLTFRDPAVLLMQDIHSPSGKVEPKRGEGISSKDE